MWSPRSENRALPAGCDLQQRHAIVSAPSAILMGVLAGYSLRDVRRAMQHGHPQMTIADLLGKPLPADLVNAQKIEDIRIAWRKWLSMRVKVVDEYNLRVLK